MSLSARTASAALLAAALVLPVAGCTGSQQPQQTSASASSQPGTPATAAPPATTPSATPTSASGAGLPAVPGIVREVEPSVVTIRTKIGLGSGVVYHSDGTIVTDAHVVEDQQKQPYKTVQVQFADGKQVPAKVVGVDDISDVAVIKAQRTGLPAPKFSSTVPEVGEMTVVIGSPLGLIETVTAGIVSGLHRNMPPSQESPQGLIDLIQTDAPISPGNSGGAVVNGRSQIIGLSEAYLPPSSGAVAIGFVTPASTVTSVVDQLLKNGKVKHAVIGIRPADISPQVAQRFNLPTTSGALVVEVDPGGPADAAGMAPGDVIVKYNGAKVGNVTDLLAAIRKTDPGQRVPIVVLRGKDTKTFTITLADRSTSQG